MDLCAALLGDLLRFDAGADATVAAFFRAQPALGQRERHALADTAFAVLRRRRWFEHLARDGAGPLHRRLALLAWQGTKVQLHASLDEGERDWLERCLANAPPASGSLHHNLPDWLANALSEQLPGAEFEALADTLLQPAPLDLRVNQLKTKREAALWALREAGFDAEPTPISPWGIRLAGKPSLRALPLLQHGEVEVQDEGSQLLALMTDAKRGEIVVDFCAGGGGKTLALGAAMRNTGRLYAWDTSGHRLAALAPRLARSGLSNVHTLQLVHEHDERIERLAGKVDRVLVDAPCSGLGTLRRNPELKWRHTPQSVQEFQRQQCSILGSAARLLKPGGRLVYATCSLLREENEAVADVFEREQGAHFVALPAAGLLAKAQVARAEELDSDGRLRLWPHRHGSDGFFAGAWQRR